MCSGWFNECANSSLTMAATLNRPVRFPSVLFFFFFCFDPHFSFFVENYPPSDNIAPDLDKVPNGAQGEPTLPGSVDLKALRQYALQREVPVSLPSQMESIHVNREVPAVVNSSADEWKEVRKQALRERAAKRARTEDAQEAQNADVPCVQSQIELLFFCHFSF